MKLSNWNEVTKEWDSTTVTQGQTDFEQKDRLGRTIGAGFYIQAQNYVDVGDDARSYSNHPALVGGPGLYFLATIFNTRNRERYQATTSMLCASAEAATRYCTAYVQKKRKDAVKKEGK